MGPAYRLEVSEKYVRINPSNERGRRKGASPKNTPEPPSRTRSARCAPGWTCKLFVDTRKHNKRHTRAQKIWASVSALRVLCPGLQHTTHQPHSRYQTSTTVASIPVFNSTHQATVTLFASRDKEPLSLAPEYDQAAHGDTVTRDQKRAV